MDLLPVQQVCNRTSLRERRSAVKGGLMLLVGALFGLVASVQAQVSSNNDFRPVLVGSVLPLEGDLKTYGTALEAGIGAAITGERVHGRPIRWLVRNDYYEPRITAEQTQALIEEDIDVMIGNLGTPTSQRALPLLARRSIPAIGFWTDIRLMPDVGHMINYRPSFADEMLGLMESALASGVKPTEICGVGQNDLFGMAVFEALKTIYQRYPETRDRVAQLEDVMAMPGENPLRNGLSPVGVYTRNALYARDAYEGIKDWESISGDRCRFVAMVGVHLQIAEVARYIRYRGENWVLGVGSAATPPAFGTLLANAGVTEGIIVNQAVPDLEADLPVVAEAREKLGRQLNSVALEGFLVGKMLLALAEDAQGRFDEVSILGAVRNRKIDLGGVVLDFTTTPEEPNPRHWRGRRTAYYNIIDTDGRYRPIDQERFVSIVKTAFAPPSD